MTPKSNILANDAEVQEIERLRRDMMMIPFWVCRMGATSRQEALDELHRLRKLKESRERFPRF